MYRPGGLIARSEISYTFSNQAQFFKVSSGACIYRALGADAYPYFFGITIPVQPCQYFRSRKSLFADGDIE